MKVQARVMEYESTVEGDKVGMTIDQSSLAHIMSVLTDLYSDPELAVIREYATNALDAHVEAGVKRPIEVTLPSPLSPFFKIRDYGTGLDAEDIRDIYSRYGTSTKRESNDVVGMLGLGCKSALTYSDQFTITSTKGNRTIQVLVSRDEDGSGSMTIVSDGPAEGEQGTEIIVPAKRVNSFEAKADKFFSVWAEDTVLVNGKHPARVDGLWLSDKLLLSDTYGEDCVVMGNVAYPWLSDEDERYSYGSYSRRFHLVAFVDIGEVLFTPSREALQGTKQVKAKLAQLRQDTANAIEPAVQRLVKNATTPGDAVTIARMGRDLGVKGALNYQGREVVLAFDRTPRDVNGVVQRHDPEEDYGSFLIAGNRSRKVNGTRSYQADPHGGGIWFTGFTAKQLSTTKREKMSVWATQNSVTIEYGQQVYVDKLTADERYWLPADVKVYDWNDVEAIKLTAAVRAESSSPRGAYTAMVAGSTAQTQAADLDTEKPIYWLHGNHYNLHSNEAVRNGLIDTDTCTIVALPENRIEKFKRDFPMAVEVSEAATKIAKDWIDSQDPAIVEAYKFQQTYAGECAKIRTLDPQRIDDPKLAEAVRLSTVSTARYSEGRKAYGRWLPYAGHESKRGNPLAGYPLIASMNGYGLPRDGKEHIYLYANAAYEAKQAENVAEAA